jgi:tryptophan-rich sensory protein
MFSMMQKYILAALAVVLLGGLSGYLSNAGGGDANYSYKKPSFNPPAYVFGPVWFVLYITIGIAGVNIYENRKRDPVSLGVFVVQLLLNFAWTYLFFALHRADLALIDIILLFLTILYLVVSPFFDSKKTSNLILVPYLLWVGFATVLNYSIFMLN